MVIARRPALVVEDTKGWKKWIDNAAGKDDAWFGLAQQCFLDRYHYNEDENHDMKHRA